jgi:hypothetical protein
MVTATIGKFNLPLNTFRVKGEDFVVLKKDFLEEMVILIKSFAQGENLLKNKKTRTFSEFLNSIPKKGKQR